MFWRLHKMKKGMAYPGSVKEHIEPACNWSDNFGHWEHRLVVDIDCYVKMAYTANM